MEAVRWGGAGAMGNEAHGVEKEDEQWTFDGLEDDLLIYLPFNVLGPHK
jgi:hypothetical protein